jgi:hypothetical protein
MTMEPMEALFLSTIGWLAADILFASFNRSWYYVVGPRLARRVGSVNAPAPPPPAPEVLEKRTAPRLEAARGRRWLVFERRSDLVYTFRRAPRRGVQLLQGTIVFDPARATYEVHGRLGVFFVAFVISLGVLFYVSRGYEDLGGRIFAGVGALSFFAFLLQDRRTSRRVAEAVGEVWR